MKKLLVLIFTFFFVLSAFGQRESVDTTAERLEIRINKQIICDRFERQLKDIPFAAVRVLTRYKIASWLWKDGNDDTDRAEDIAVRAIDDLYANKAEIPVFYLNVLRPRLLSLLDMHAKDAAKKLEKSIRSAWKMSKASLTLCSVKKRAKNLLPMLPSNRLSINPERRK